MRNRRAILLAVAGLLGVMSLPAAAAASGAPGASGGSGAPGASAAASRALAVSKARAASDTSVFSFLFGAVAFAPSNAWAVGWLGVTGTTTLFSQSFHWNGHQWVDVNVGTGGNINGLESVSATGPSDIWGAGFTGTGPLIVHNNGHKWTSVPVSFDGGAAQLNGVDARTKSDAWAVGFDTPASGSTSAGFAEHWNGHHWMQVTMPSINGTFVQFNSVLDLGLNNVLAVGNYNNKAGVEQSLAMRWNGHVWTRVSVPAFSSSFLAGISGTASAGVTAVGGVTTGGHNIPLIERWTGTRFVRVAQPVGLGELNAVTVLSRTNAYAVGNTDSLRTLVEHYNGKRWAPVPTPNAADGGLFASVAATPSGSFVVGVGFHGPTLSNRLLIEQGNGRTWHIFRD